MKHPRDLVREISNTQTRDVTDNNRLRPWQKLLMILHCADPALGLTFTELLVMVFLIFRRNPSTGRCDPSIECLSRDSGKSVRGVQTALTRLEAKGLVRRHRISPVSRNQFVLFEVDEAAVVNQIRYTKTTKPDRQVNPDIDLGPAMCCAPSPQPAAPKKKKETSNRLPNPALLPNSASDVRTEMLRKETTNAANFEASIRKIFEKKGIGYVGLLTVPTSEFESIYKQYAESRIGFSDAVSALLSAYERANRNS